MAKQSFSKNLKFEIIYVEKDEDVSSLLERISKSKNDHLILVLPEKAKLTSSILNFLLLAKEVEKIGKKIYLDTQEEEARAMAEEAKIPLLEVKTKILTSKGPAFLRDVLPPQRRRIYSEISFQKPKEASFKEHSFSLKGEVKNERKKERKKVPLFLFYFLIGVVVLILGFFGFLYFFSRAEIRLISQKDFWHTQAGVMILEAKDLKGIDYENFKLPGEFFKFSREAVSQFPATELKDIQSKARGIIKIYNAYSSQAQILVANTRFLSQEGKLFRLTKQVTIPGAQVIEGKIVPSFIEAEVVADEAGEAYNIGPSKFTIPGFQGTPKYEKFYGISEKPMTGGASGKVKVVSQKDLENAQENLRKGLVLQLEEELKNKIPPGFKVLEEAKILSLEKLEFSKKVDEPAENFEARMKLSLKAIAFKEEDLKKLFLYQASKAIADFDKKEVYSFELNYGVPRVDFERRLFSLPVAVSLSLRTKLNLEDLINELLGVKKRVAEEILKKSEGIEKIEIKYWPKFFPYLPFRKANLKIFLD